MSTGSKLVAGEKNAKLSKKTLQEKPSLLDWLKKGLPWSKKSKKKGSEIYPLF